MARPTLFSHRKLNKLAQRLQSRALAIGSLELIWQSANESGTSILGDLDDVEGVADWRGARGELVAALMECGTAGGGAGFIERREDGRYEIHDYWHHAPDYVRKRAKREQERRENGDALRADDRSDDSAAPGSDQSLTGQSPVADRSLTGQNASAVPKNGDFGRTPTPTPTPTREEVSKSSDTSSQGGVGEGSRAKRSTEPRGTRCPDPFLVTPNMRAWAAKEAPHASLDVATREFVDYWRAIPGQRGRKTDWVATWRNRMRECEAKAVRNGGARPGRESIGETIARLNREADEAGEPQL